ncbi:TetR/AcrR family transcriptional regulator [Fodinicola acaciae]|uniref:TetR/AcrR family transcriptional regulator n=1 Tax=Fodinicola acaciae TaxID=2681555 RepID=UPI0013D002F5|nr:TetR/AcrR family transcriptional regulator [Fodinicola acaciae]
MSTTRSYHHGDLRDALVRAAVDLLAERGVERFSLRETARRADVSPAAPAHHFGDARGLLTEVAARGFDALRQELRSAGGDPTDRLYAQAVAYVRFALAKPGQFQLMFRRDMLKSADPRLRAASKQAHGELVDAVRGYLGPDRAWRPAATGAWSLVHGFAQLALDGKFDDTDDLDAMLIDVLELTFPRTR